MATIKKTTFYQKDLLKIFKKLNVSVRQISKDSGIEYYYLIKVANGKQSMPEEKYLKLKDTLNKYLK